MLKVMAVNLLSRTPDKWQGSVVGMTAAMGSRRGMVDFCSCFVLVDLWFGGFSLLYVGIRTCIICADTQYPRNLDGFGYGIPNTQTIEE